MSALQGNEKPEAASEPKRLTDTHTHKLKKETSLEKIIDGACVLFEFWALFPECG